MCTFLIGLKEARFFATCSFFVVFARLFQVSSIGGQQGVGGGPSLALPSALVLVLFVGCNVLVL